jgi:hypothetical protein
MHGHLQAPTQRRIHTTMRLGIMPRHCSANSRGATIPATVRRYAAWSATAPRHCTTHSRTADAPHPRILTRTALERATFMPPPSKPLLDAHRTRHDAPPEARFARTTVYSMALYAIPPHVARTVWHACKLLPPWPIKGGAAP